MTSIFASPLEVPYVISDVGLLRVRLHEEHPRSRIGTKALTTMEGGESRKFPDREHELHVYFIAYRAYVNLPNGVNGLFVNVKRLACFKRFLK